MHFRNYRLRKKSSDKCLKSPVLEHPLIVNMLKEPKHYWNNMFAILWAILSGKMSLLVIFEILELFIDTFTTDDKYFFKIVRICRNQFKWKYLKKTKNFSRFAAFLKFKFHLKLCFKKDDLHSFCLSESTDSERCD